MFHEAVRRSTDVGLPAISELLEVKARAQACASTEVSEAVQVSELLRALSDARASGVDMTALASVESQARTLAAEKLARSLTLELTDARPFIDAWEVAEVAGVPAQDITAARASVKGRAVARVTTAMTAADGMKSAEAIKELGEAMKFGLKLGMSQPDVEAARELYSRQLEADFVGVDMAFVEQAVESADAAKVAVPADLSSWAAAFTKVSHFATETIDDKITMQSAVEALDFARSSGMPEPPEMITLSDKVKTKATADLQAATTGQSAQVLQQAVDSAIKAGVPESDLSAAREVLAASLP